RVLDELRRRGASFLRELAAGCASDEGSVREGLGELVAAGFAASDGFAGVREILHPPRRGPGRSPRPNAAGRWSLLQTDGATSPDAIVETRAWSLLRRYGVVFRRLLARESGAPAWRDLARAYRRLEARGEIRGGRFVTGMSGEQFALPDAVD